MKSKFNKIFRKEALDNYNQADKLDSLIKIIQPKHWIVLVTICLLLLTLIIWGFWGSIPTRVEGKGILLVEGGVIYSASGPEGKGVVTEVLVKPGDVVKPDQVVAYLENDDLEEQVKVTKQYLVKLKEDYQALEVEAATAITKHKASRASQAEILKNIIASETKNLQQTSNLVQVKKQAMEEGLDTRENYLTVVREYFSTLQGIERAKEQLIQSEVSEQSFIQQWDAKLRDLNLKVKDEDNKLNNLQVQLNSSEIVRSPVAGMVTGVQKNIGDIVLEGDSILNITSLGEGLDAVTFLHSKDSRKVKKGMPALISPHMIKKEEFGSIKGTVITISPYPASKKVMMAILHNEELVNKFLEEGAPFIARIRLQKDKKTYSGYAWTSKAGPKHLIKPGEVADIKITVREQSPVSLLIPAVKKIISGEYNE